MHQFILVKKKALISFSDISLVFPLDFFSTDFFRNPTNDSITNPEFQNSQKKNVFSHEILPVVLLKNLPRIHEQFLQSTLVRILQKFFKIYCQNVKDSRFRSFNSYSKDLFGNSSTEFFTNFQGVPIRNRKRNCTKNPSENFRKKIP